MVFWGSKVWKFECTSFLTPCVLRRRNSTSSSARLCRLPQARTTTSSTAWAMNFLLKNKKMPENLEVSGYLLIFAEKSVKKYGQTE